MSIDLTRFCANDTDPREHLYKPWKDGKWVYATNGHMAVRVAAELYPDAVDKPEEAPDVGGLFRKYLEDRQGLEFLLMPPIKGLHKCMDCEGTGKVRAIKCPDCTDGEFRHGEHTYQCQNCEGSPAGAGWEFLDEYMAVQPHEVKRTCQACDGLGFSMRQNGNTQLGEAGYSTVYLAFFAGLPQVRVCPGEPAPEHWKPSPAPAIFTFDGGHGLLMPRLS
jgi:hypothetical protein